MQQIPQTVLDFEANSPMPEDASMEVDTVERGATAATISSNPREAAASQQSQPQPLATTEACDLLAEPNTTFSSDATLTEASGATGFTPVTLQLPSAARQGTPEGETVRQLHLATSTGAEGEVEALLCRGGPQLLQAFSRLTRSSPQHLAAAAGQRSVVRMLVKYGCSIASYDSDGNTPLHVSCRNADAQTTSTIISATRKTNRYVLASVINARNNAGMTCFLLAASTGNASLMTLLARAGSDVNSQDGLSGRSALHHAAAAGNEALVKFLLETLRVEINRRDFAGNTPLGLVEQHKMQDLVLFLIRHGGEVRDTGKK